MSEKGTRVFIHAPLAIGATVRAVLLCHYPGPGDLGKTLADRLNAPSGVHYCFGLLVLLRDASGSFGQGGSSTRLRQVSDAR